MDSSSAPLLQFRQVTLEVEGRRFLDGAELRVDAGESVIVARKVGQFGEDVERVTLIVSESIFGSSPSEMFLGELVRFFRDFAWSDAKLGLTVGGVEIAAMAPRDVFEMKNLLPD